ncbi:MAG: hypothetical protein ACJ71Z_10020 [Aeromicrobium sp.]
MVAFLIGGLSELLLVNREREQGGTDLAIFRLAVGVGNDPEGLR